MMKLFKNIKGVRKIWHSNRLKKPRNVNWKFSWPFYLKFHKKKKKTHLSKTFPTKTNKTTLSNNWHRLRTSAHIFWNRGWLRSQIGRLRVIYRNHQKVHLIADRHLKKKAYSPKIHFTQTTPTTKKSIHLRSSTLAKKKKLKEKNKSFDQENPR